MGEQEPLIESVRADASASQNGDNMKGSAVPVIINTVTQVYYMVSLRDPAPATWQSQWTNIINITFAGM